MESSTDQQVARSIVGGGGDATSAASCVCSTAADDDDVVAAAAASASSISASDDSRHPQSSAKPQHHCQYLQRYDTYCHRPDPALSDDENYMDICMLVTRNSICNQGHMGCVLVSGDPATHHVSSQQQYEERLYQNIIGVSTNQPLYSSLDSDVHAEIGALGEASRCGNVTGGCTAYIAMPPCKTCFGALLSAGCKRIVTPREPSEIVARVAKLKNIEMDALQEKKMDGVTARIGVLVSKAHSSDDAERRKAEITAKRKARKEMQRQKKEKKRRMQEENRLIHAKTNSNKS